MSIEYQISIKNNWFINYFRTGKNRFSHSNDDILNSPKYFQGLLTIYILWKIIILLALSSSG